MRSAAFVLAATLVALASSAAAGAGADQTAGPEVVLVTPADGGRVINSAEFAATFGWRVDWRDAPASGSVLVTVRVASDEALTQNAVENTFSCQARSAGCKSSFRPNRLYSGQYHWRVSLSGAVRATSPTWSFVAVRRGGSPGADRSKPRVRALPGIAQRGQTAFFSARVADDRKIVRLRAALTRKGHERARASAAFRSVTWARPQTMFSSRPLPRGLAAGPYRLCITAWDRAGNAARSCAPYRIR